MFKTLAVLAVSCVVLSACAHVETIHEKDFDNIGAADSGVILTIHLASEDAMVVEGGCKLNLHRTDGFTDYPVDLHSGSQEVFAKLPPGDYKIHDIECLEHNWDLTEKEWPSFSSVAGKISVIQPVDFHYAGKLMMAAGLKGRQAAQTELLAVLGRMPQSEKDRVISGYEKGPVTVEMIQENSKWGKLHISDVSSGKVLDKEASKKAGYPTFTSCFRGEALVNSLWLGDVQFEANFQAGHFEGLEVKSAKNTFSNQFMECVKAEVQSYQPKSLAKLKYSFFL